MAPVLDWGKLVSTASGEFEPAVVFRTMLTEAVAMETFERAVKLVAEEFGRSSWRFRKVRVAAIVV